MIDFEKQEFRLNPKYRLQYEEAQQCHVLLYPEGLVKLSDTATEILGRCVEAISAHSLIAELQRDYPGADSLPDDVRGFLNEAATQGWIVAVDVGKADDA